MPLFWRFLLKSYFRIFFLCISSFIAILLVTKLKDIAEFASYSGNSLSVILYTLYKIPQILPLSILISSLIATILVFQKLTESNELTALRSSGISIKNILFPIIIASFFLAAVNFYITSEISPMSYFKSKELIYDQTSINPLTVLQRQNSSKLKKLHVEIGDANRKNFLENVLVILPNHADNRLSIVSTKNIYLKNEMMEAKDVSVISHTETKNPLFFDNLIIENQKSMQAQSNLLSDFIRSKRWSMVPKSLPMRMLLIKCESDPKIKKDFSIAEILRRFAMSLSTVTLTLIGACFSLQIGKLYNKKSIIYASLLALIVLISLIIGKGMKTRLFLSILSYAVPQIAVLFLAFKRLKKISRGQE